MARGAFFNVPFHGHTNATFPVVRELVERGEDITYYLTDSFRPQVERAGARFHRYESTVEEGLKSGTVGFLPARMPAESRAVIPQLLEAVRAQRPDYVVYDPLCLWGQILANHLRIPAVLFRPTMVVTARGGASLDFMKSRIAMFPGLFEQAGKDIAALQQEYGLPPTDLWGMLGHEEPLNLVCVPRSFQSGGEAFDERYVFVGPSIRERGDTGDFPLAHLEGGPVLYISLGTVFNNWPEFYRMCFEAFGGTPWRVVLSTGHAVNVAELGAVPGNFLVRPSVPQLEVLERTSVFVTHGGANSLMESFAHAVPVVVIPQMAEQPLNAVRVAELELGLALQRETVTVEQLRRAVARVSSEPAFREKARSMQQEVRASGGYRRAAEAILAYREKRAGASAS
ncbi:antibiotic resistance macrolide glycosyltransferase [Cystobacter fuscus DSM 2262]|uniref:Antibiotic resistance macrolide glycosyltransferase n=1 Tax=Cystobacter fuscus (strain ATCC 25194 / DSM 2262 / NBRC 100088 / M29) TaxID=1242864 RepID=S9NT41_CYSF2|nr:macrolide family glycosyltransferase [Cystobacter fuscus]EPX55290.1 antibiotic resistance macrolide glycosyltransferase [Cystobacter fuscus DSM 2262]